MCRTNNRCHFFPIVFAVEINFLQNWTLFAGCWVSNLGLKFIGDFQNLNMLKGLGNPESKTGANKLLRVVPLTFQVKLIKFISCSLWPWPFWKYVLFILALFIWVAALSYGLKGVCGVPKWNLGAQEALGRFYEKRN